LDIQYIYNGTPVARPPIGQHSTGRVSGAAGWGGRVTLAFLKVSYIIAIRNHFISKILSLIESYLALSYVLP